MALNHFVVHVDLPVPWTDPCYSSQRIVEDHPEGEALAGMHAADAMAQGGPVITAADV